MEIAELAAQPNKCLRQEDNQSHQESPSNPNKDDTSLDDGSVKRHKPYYNNIIILNLLDGDDDDDEQEPSDHDLSAMFTTFQRELAHPISSLDDYYDHQQTHDRGIDTDIISDELSQLEYYHQDLDQAEKYDAAPSSVATSADEGEDENVRSVMRDLLEASDDELGIPTYVINDENNVSDDSNNNDRSGENIAPFGFGGDYGFWEIEDEAANRYTVLQSQLFM